MLEHGVLPVLVVFTNESDYPIVLDELRFRLVTRDRAKLRPTRSTISSASFTAIRPALRRQDNPSPATPGRNSHTASCPG